MSKIFQVPASIHKIETLMDGAFKFTVYSNFEISPEDGGILLGLRGKSGWFLFSEVEPRADEIDLPDFVPEFKGDKTPSRRLRSILYLLWKENGAVGSSEDYYRAKMEEILDHFKSKLPPRDEGE